MPARAKAASIRYKGHAIGIFAGHDGGDRGGIGHAARQGLWRHVGAHHRRADPMPFAMSAAVFEANMLPDPGSRRRDGQLLTDIFADAMQRALATGADLLLFWNIVFDTLTRQVGRQRFRRELLDGQGPDDRRGACQRRQRGDYPRRCADR